MKTRLTLSVFITLVLTACATHNEGMPNRRPAMATNPATVAYMQEMHGMSESMHSMKPANDADMDFVMMMKPHHQAAVAMAHTELQYGRDPELRRMAHAIIAGQTKEIGDMNRWDARHGM